LVSGVFPMLNVPPDSMDDL